MQLDIYDKRGIYNFKSAYKEKNLMGVNEI